MKKFTFLVTLFTATILFGCSIASKEGERCIQDNNCDWGLQCGLCSSSTKSQPKCTRLVPLHPYLQVKGLPYNRYSWLTTRGSYATIGAKSSDSMVSPIFLPTNQDDSITDQLSNGVRGLMLDTYDYKNEIWLCYKSCTNYTAFQPAINALNKIRTFLETNPLEVVTIFLDDNVTTPDGLNKLFDAAGLRKFWFPVSKMPKHGGNWPTIDDMIKNNHRLVVFTSRSEKEASEGIAYKWNYLVENQNGSDMMINGSCTNRAESLPMNTTSKSLVLVNHFRVFPDITVVCKDNSGLLVNMVRYCSLTSGNRWPNFIAVDFYKRSDNGEVPNTIDIANGRLVCGCDNIALCKENMKFGACSHR